MAINFELRAELLSRGFMDKNANTMRYRSGSISNYVICEIRLDPVYSNHSESWGDRHFFSVYFEDFKECGVPELDHLHISRCSMYYDELIEFLKLKRIYSREEREEYELARRRRFRL